MTECNTIASRLCDLLMEQAEGITVQDVRIGLGYTAVQLDDQRTGVAYTFRDCAQGGCTIFQRFRPIAGKGAGELLELLKSPDPIEAAVGLACANALCNQLGDGMLPGDILEQLDLGAEDRVAMVGLFEPLVEGICSRAKSLTIFEKADRPHPLVRPAEDVWTVLPECQVALITATSILNRTIDTLLAAAAHCRVVAVLGASTPLLPQAFSHTPVKLLSGVIVEKPDGILQVVSEAGGMRFFKGLIRKVSLKMPVKF